MRAFPTPDIALTHILVVEIRAFFRDRDGRLFEVSEHRV